TAMPSAAATIPAAATVPGASAAVPAAPATVPPTATAVESTTAAAVEPTGDELHVRITDSRPSLRGGRRDQHGHGGHDDHAEVEGCDARARATKHLTERSRRCSLLRMVLQYSDSRPGGGSGGGG